MLYSNLTKEEIDQISIILNEHGVVHEVLVDNELIERQNAEEKFIYTPHMNRRSRGFYNLIIEPSEFTKLSTTGCTQLERYNIYPELSEEVFHSDTAEIIPVKSSNKNPLLNNPIVDKIFISILPIALLIYLLNWIDRYVVKLTLMTELKRLFGLH